MGTDVNEQEGFNVDDESAVLAWLDQELDEDQEATAVVGETLDPEVEERLQASARRAGIVGEWT